MVDNKIKFLMAAKIQKYLKLVSLFSKKLTDNPQPSPFPTCQPPDSCSCPDGYRIEILPTGLRDDGRLEG